MAYCEECGAQLPEGSKFCAQCGTAVPARQAAAEATSGRAPGADGAARVATRAAEALAATGVVEAPDAAGEFVAGMWNDGVLPSAEAAVAQVARVAQGAAQQAQSHQPSVRRSSGSAEPEPKPKKKSKLPLIVAAAVVVVLVAVYVVPRFIPHPHDPHEDMASPPAASQASPSASATAGSSGDNASNTSSAAEPGASTSQGVSDSSSSQQSTQSAAASSAATPASPKSFSTNEWPTLADFTWLTGETAKGNVPAGATRLTDLGVVTGGWKAYLYDSDMEWLLHVSIDVGQSDVAVALDWYYARDGATGQSHEDTTPTSFFSGTWDSGILDATGSGRVTLAAFWQQDGHQYAAGSLMWPDGNVSTLALVRP